MAPHPLLALLLCAAAAAAAPLRAPTEKPNVVLFFVDDLGYGDVGFTGHPTTKTPTLDRLAGEGKVLTTWYSGAALCSASRAALMTGRQWVRFGMPQVFGPTAQAGLNTNETTLGDQMKSAGYATAAVGKWHLGQRLPYLPASRGFDRYLGVPFSDDMGQAVKSKCEAAPEENIAAAANVLADFAADGAYVSLVSGGRRDAGATWLPLVQQLNGTTTVVEQPADLTTLADKYIAFATDFVSDHKEDPFFLYLPFSHVHADRPWDGNPSYQYAGCGFQGTTKRGEYGDALRELDHITLQVANAVKQHDLDAHTLMIFTSDNGPWLRRQLAAGSVGLFYARSAGYWNIGKASTWEGGIREPAFIRWPGQIAAGTRSQETVSSLDVFPTLSKLVGAPLPPGVAIDGKDASDVYFKDGAAATSPHDTLFFYGGFACNRNIPSAVRFGPWKAHFGTGPGEGGCFDAPGCNSTCAVDSPVLFNIDEDPTEAYPLAHAEHEDVLQDIKRAFEREVATMVWGAMTPAPDGPGEGPHNYAVCCDRSRGCCCGDPRTCGSA